MAHTGLSRLVWITTQLRTYCPWTQTLTHHELTEYLIEEAYEAVEVIESIPARRWDDEAQGAGIYELLRNELGDVLFQVTLHSAIAAQAGEFNIDDVAEAISEKMVRRNPHVFDSNGHLLPKERLGAVSVHEVEKNWEQIKQAEKANEAPNPPTDRPSTYDLPPGLPALAAAAKIIDRAGRQPSNPLGKPPEADQINIEVTKDDIGAQLFELVRIARSNGVDLEAELRQYITHLK